MAGSKRTATRDINHENWDQEDEPEEIGQFQKASEEVLKTRVFKTAKRRNLSSVSQVRSLSDTRTKQGYTLSL